MPYKTIIYYCLMKGFGHGFAGGILHYCHRSTYNNLRRNHNKITNKNKINIK